jgi:hypothetical protein
VRVAAVTGVLLAIGWAWEGSPSWRDWLRWRV